MVALLVAGASHAQVSFSPPKSFKQAAPLGSDGFANFNLSGNSSDIINQELTNADTVAAIAASAGLGTKELATVAIARESMVNELWIYQIGEPDTPFKILSHQLTGYRNARLTGHTRAFILNGITNRAAIASIADPDLRMLATNEDFESFPIWLMSKEASGTRTNKAGEIQSIYSTITISNGVTRSTSLTNMPTTDEICSWATFKVVDGGIKWVFTLQFKANGELDNIFTEKRDAIEDNPKFQRVLKQVEGEVTNEMRQNGTFGKFGSVHTFWRLKQEKLKALGIEWRSPGELGNGIYD